MLHSLGYDDRMGMTDLKAKILAFLKRAMSLGIWSLWGLMCVPVATVHASEIWSYPGASLEQSNAKEEGLQTVYLSAPKRVSNELRFERIEQLNAEMNTYLYRLPSLVNVEQAFDYYSEQFKTQGKLEYQCVHRACGTSSNWANKVFGIAKLSGRDDDQYYLSALLNDGNRVSVYLVRNARRQSYVFVQVFNSGKASAELSPSVFTLSDFTKPESLSDALVTGLSDELSNNSNAWLMVQLYLPAEGTYEAFSALFQSKSNALTQDLSKRISVAPDRIRVLNAGPFYQSERDKSEQYQPEQHQEKLSNEAVYRLRVVTP